MVSVCGEGEGEGEVAESEPPLCREQRDSSMPNVEIVTVCLHRLSNTT
jgi:hypothetical protein